MSAQWRVTSRQFTTYLIKNTKLRGSELRVVIETVVVQNNPTITDRACNGCSIADSQWALWEASHRQTV
jgi:hypothetical protein